MFIIFPSAPGSAESTSDLQQQSQGCEQSLTWSGKHSPSRTWLLRLKREPWMQHLSTRICMGSHGNFMLEMWTSYLAAFHASRSLHHVLSDLESLGFRATAGCFTAAEVGLSHQRKRWFILGLAYAEGDDWRPRICGKEAGTGSNSERRRGSTGSSQDVADRVEQGLEGHARHEHEEGGQAGECEISRSTSPSSVQARGVARPGERQHEWEEPRTLEPGVGCPTHGIPARTHRLRALGNAVVPAVAEKAFKTLYRRLREHT